MKSEQTTAQVAASFGVVELRRYAMRPGQRDALIALFEREFLRAQIACGMVPIGHFRDLDDPNAFAWLRGFERMESRRDALHAFYTSETWMRNRDAANATLLDSDNVLLLRNARPERGFPLADFATAAAGNAAATVRDVRSGSFVAVSVLMLDRRADAPFVAAFEEFVLPRARACAERVAYLVSEERPNDFPRLPVRESECAFVAAGVCRTTEALDAWRDVFAEANVPAAMQSRIVAVEMHRLEPAAASLFP